MSLLLIGCHVSDDGSSLSTVTVEDKKGSQCICSFVTIVTLTPINWNESYQTVSDRHTSQKYITAGQIA
jgi:hypothetical protein